MILAGILVKSSGVNNIERMEQKGSIHKGTIYIVFTRKIPIAIITRMGLGIVTILDVVKTNITRTHI